MHCGRSTGKRVSVTARRRGIAARWTIAFPACSGESRITVAPAVRDNPSTSSRQGAGGFLGFNFDLQLRREVSMLNKLTILTFIALAASSLPGSAHAQAQQGARADLAGAYRCE